MTQAPTPTPPEPTSKLSLASMILGIASVVGFGIFTGIPAIITGAIAVTKKETDRNMAIAGIVMGAIGTLLMLLVLALIVLLIIFAQPGDVQYMPSDMAPIDQPWMQSSET